MTFADSVNIGRRLSARAEPDMIQEDFMEDDSKFTSAYCTTLASKLSSVDKLPTPCKKYPEVVSLYRKNTTGTKSDAAIAFQGMRAGSAATARANRAKGKEHYAQVQRRYTQSQRFNSKRSSTAA